MPHVAVSGTNESSLVSTGSRRHANGLDTFLTLTLHVLEEAVTKSSVWI